MTYRTILVHLDSSRQARRRLDVAVRLAAAHGARLVGLYSVFASEPQSYYGGGAEYLLERQQQRETSRDELARQFAHAARGAGVQAEWRAPLGAPNAVVPLHARHADLIVASQPDPDDLEAFVAPHFVENLVLSAGGPVWLVPYAGTIDSLGTRPMIAWDCSRAAARAWHDALPALKRAARSTVVMLTELDDDQPAASAVTSEIVTALKLHGVPVDIHVHHMVARREHGEVLLSQAADLGADLIVAGAYGHTRVMEMMLGGVTRTLLRAMTVPVLMSH